MWITRLSINNPVFATMMMVALCVLGIFSYNRLRVERMPDITIPFVFIQVMYPGAAPEAVENDITKPTEEVVNTVNGVKTIRSNSWEGRSETYIEFRLDTDMDRAVQDIRDKIAALRPGWPRESKEPLILRGDFDNTQPIVFLAVTSPTRTLRELTTFTDQVIVKRFQNVPGVGQVRVNGGVARQIQVHLKPAQMQSQGVGVDEVIAAIRAANMDVPAGRVVQGPTEQLVRRNVQSLADDVVQRGIDSRFTIRISFDGFVHESMDRFEAARILVFQCRGENIIDDVNRALRRFPEIPAIITAPILQHRRFTEANQTIVGV